jgi:hypothetical protein
MLKRGGSDPLGEAANDSRHLLGLSFTLSG